MPLKWANGSDQRSFDAVMAGLDDHNPLVRFALLLCWCSDRGAAWPRIQALVSLVVCLYSDNLSHRAFG